MSGKQCSGVLKFEDGTDEYMLNCDYTPGCDVKIVAHYTTILMLCEVQVDFPPLLTLNLICIKSLSIITLFTYTISKLNTANRG